MFTLNKIKAQGFERIRIFMHIFGGLLAQLKLGKIKVGLPT